MRILVANEPRSYREVIAAAVQALRPHIEVVLSTSVNLERDLARLAPQLVVCSGLSPSIGSRTLTWIVLYPEGKSQAVISIGGKSTTLDDLEFDHLLRIVDQTEKLVGAR